MHRSLAALAISVIIALGAITPAGASTVVSAWGAFDSTKAMETPGEVPTVDPTVEPEVPEAETPATPEPTPPAPAQEPPLEPTPDGDAPPVDLDEQFEEVVEEHGETIYEFETNSTTTFAPQAVPFVAGEPVGPNTVQCFGDSILGSACALGGTSHLGAAL